MCFSQTREDLLAMRDHLIAKGIEIEAEFDWPNGARSIYFRDPLGHRIELACYTFEPPSGFRHVEVMRKAHDLRVARGAHAIEDVDLANAIEALVAGEGLSLS